MSDTSQHTQNIDLKQVEEFITFAEKTSHEDLQNIIALRKMPDGSRLDDSALAAAMQALIRFESKHLPLDERTGFIHKSTCAKDH